MAEKRVSRASAADAQSIIETSGNALLCRVVNYFRSKNWTTRLSQYYIDATTTKAREIDLIAERVFEFVDAGQQNLIRVHVRLCIECKYVMKPVVFWFDDADLTSINRWVDEHPPFTKLNSYSKELHYWKYGQRIARLFASGAANEENEPIFRALNQVLHGFVNTRGQSIVETKSRERVKIFTFAYPIIVFSGFDCFYATSVGGTQEPVALRENFLFEVNYAYPNSLGKSIPQYFLVDMVSLDTLDELLQCIDDEIAAAKVIA